MDIRASAAASLYAGMRQKVQPDAARAVQQGVAGFVETLRQGETTARDALTGKADPTALVQALAQTELAVETAVTVRDKVVEAYQEILRMPV